MRVILAILLCYIWFTPVLAARVEFLGENPSIEFDIQVVDPMQACHIGLSGLIQKGDYSKIEAQVSLLQQKAQERNSSRLLILCLNSPGGSFAEAVKIGKYLKKKFVGTKIESGSRCESACSLIFMAGNFAAHESGVYHWRVLHPQAKLGFHAPSLTLSEGNYNSKTVQKAYNLALKTISDTIFEVMTSTNFEDGLSLEVSLLGEMLKTPSTKMSYVDTVDEAGRWKITLVPVWGERMASDLLLAQGCINAYSWERDETAIVDLYGDPKNLIVNRTTTNEGNIKVTVTLNEMTGDGCEFFTERGANKLSQFKRVDITFRGSHGISPEHFLNPATPIASLASLTPPRQKTLQPELPDFSGSTGTCLVISGNTVIDEDPCLRADEIRQDGKGKRVDIASFVWPSGAKTVIVFKSQQLSINGHRTKNVSNAIAGDKASCVINPSSGNIFCYRPK